jgi:hypothetical protein
LIASAELVVLALRYTWLVPDVVIELLVTETALDKLGARNISAEETEQLMRNDHATLQTKPNRARDGS